MQVVLRGKVKVPSTFTKKLESSHIMNLKVHKAALETKVKQTYLRGVDGKKWLNSVLKSVI